MVEVFKMKGGGGLGVMELSMTLTLDLQGWSERENRPDGQIGRAISRGADVFQERAIALQASSEYTTPTAEGEGRVGRWDTGESTTGMHKEFFWNESVSGVRISPGTPWWKYQELGTRYIAPAPVMGRALISLKPADFL